VLNVMRGLPSSYTALQALITHLPAGPRCSHPRGAYPRPPHTCHDSSSSSTTFRALVAAPPTSSASPPAPLLGAPPPGPSGGGGCGGRRGRGGGGRGTPTQVWPLLSLLFPGVRPGRPLPTYLHVALPGSGRRVSSLRSSRLPWPRVQLHTRRPGLHPLPSAQLTLDAVRGGGIRLPWRSPASPWP
jgi:hypothetical protein